jgi:hypothetical protein
MFRGLHSKFVTESLRRPTQRANTVPAFNRIGQAARTSGRNTRSPLAARFIDVSTLRGRAHFGSSGSGATACRQKGQGMESGKVDEDRWP